MNARIMSCLVLSALLGVGCSAVKEPANSAAPGAFRTVRAARAETPPVLDGRLDDACWQRAEPVTGFLVHRTDKLATWQSFGYVSYDEANLYIAVKCLMPMGVKPAGQPRPGDDAPIWGGDEVVEIMVDPGKSGSDYYQIAINAYGARFDCTRRHGGRTEDDSWNGNWEVKTHIADGYWSVELSVPYHVMGIAPQTASTWGINLCRDAAIADHFELSSIAVNGAFNAAPKFAALTGVNADFQKYAVAFGTYATQLSLAGKPSITLGLPITNATGKKRTVNIERSFVAEGDKEETASRVVTLGPGETFVLPMETLPTEEDLFDRGGRIYFKSQAPVTRKIVVADAGSGMILSSVVVTKPCFHMAMDLDAPSPWQKEMTGDATTVVTMKVTVDVQEEQRAAGTLEVVLASSETDKVVARQSVPGPARITEIRFATTDIPWDAYEARAVFRNESGREVLAVRRAAPVLPGGKQRLKVLNNFVTELMNAKERGLLGEREIAFMNPRDGWCFFSMEGDAAVRLDGMESPILPVAAWFNPFEAMRYLQAGRHKLTVTREGDGSLDQLIVRAIPALQFDFYDAIPHIAPYGKYDWDFLSKDVLPNINVMISVPGLPPRPEHIRLWKDIGRRWVQQVSRPRPSVVNFDIAAAEDAVKRVYDVWAASPGYQHPLMDGVIVDEFASSDMPIFDVYRKAAERLNANFKGRIFMPYAGGQTYLWGLDKSSRLAMTALAGGGYGCPEHYLAAPEKAPRQYIDMMVKALAEWERAIPGVNPRVLVVLGYLSSPPENLNIYPTTSFQVYMDMQMQALATGPGLFGLGGVEWYRSAYAAEETVRWMGRLYRHYCIEGKTGPATRDPYELSHLENPDFAEGTRGWQIEPAEEGSIRHDQYVGYGYFEGRYAYRSKAGDAFALMRRSAERPNKFSQQIKNLAPGRLYSMKMFTGDYQDLVNGISSKKLHAVAIELDGVEILPGPKSSFQHPWPTGYWVKRGKFDRARRYWMNYHWRVFRATGKTARLTVSDWKGENDPGGPAGQELMYNFIQVQPYLGE